MLLSYGLALLCLSAVLCGWVGVQIAWKKTFAPRCADPDALAGREGCHGLASPAGCGGMCAVERTGEERRR